jgi:hypothetical protein
MKKKLIACLLICSCLSQSLAHAGVIDDLQHNSIARNLTFKREIEYQDESDVIKVYEEISGIMDLFKFFCPTPARNSSIEANNKICTPIVDGGSRGFIDVGLMDDGDTQNIAKMLNAMVFEVQNTALALILDLKSAIESEDTEALKSETLKSYVFAAKSNLRARLWVGHPLLNENMDSFIEFAELAYQFSAQSRLEFEELLSVGPNGKYTLNATAAVDFAEKAHLPLIIEGDQSAGDCSKPNQECSAPNATVCNTTEVRDAICPDVSQPESPLAGSKNECSAPETQGNQAAGSAESAHSSKQNNFGPGGFWQQMLSHPVRFIFNSFSSFYVINAMMTAAPTVDLSVNLGELVVQLERQIKGLTDSINALSWDKFTDTAGTILQNTKAAKSFVSMAVTPAVERLNGILAGFRGLVVSSSPQMTPWESSLRGSQHYSVFKKALPGTLALGAALLTEHISVAIKNQRVELALPIVEVFWVTMYPLFLVTKANSRPLHEFYTQPLKFGVEWAIWATPMMIAKIISAYTDTQP